MRRHRIN